MQELFIIPGFILMHPSQLLLLILGRKRGALVFAKHSRICRRETGTVPHPSPDVPALSLGEVAVLAGYPA